MTDYWKGVAIARLREYDTLCRAVENLARELELLPLQGGPGSDRRLESLMKRRDVRERLKLARTKKKQVDQALAALTPQDRLVLQMLDITPARGNGGRLCQLLNCEIANVYRRRHKALRQFAAALFGT